MQCKANGCNGVVDVANSVTVKFVQGCLGRAYVCQKCGRMHHTTGHLMFGANGRPSFYRQVEASVKEAG